MTLFARFLGLTVDQLDTVVIIEVVADRDYDAAIKVIRAGNISHGRCGSDVQQVGICAGSGQSSPQTVLEYIRAAARILADNDTSKLAVSVALTESIIIQAEESHVEAASFRQHRYTTGAWHY